MKAIKQEKIIAAITAGLLSGSAIMFLFNGVGINKADDSVAAVKETAREMAKTETPGAADDSADSVLNLSGIDVYTLGSPYEEESSTSDEKESETETEQETVPYKYENTFIVNVSEYLNVRENTSSESAVVGKIYAGGGGEVLEKGEQWTKIKSGNVEGYVNNEYVWFAHDAEAHMAEVCAMNGVVTTDSLRVRKGPGTDRDVITVLNTGTSVAVMSADSEWAKINYAGIEGYVSAQYINIEYVIGTGITAAEEQEAIRLEQERIAAEEKRKADEAAAAQARWEQAVKNSAMTQTVRTSAYSVSEEDAYLLACTVCAEAGYENYEGKLAVANIILNRLRMGYGSSIREIVYARGQFAVVTDGALNRVINNGPNAESIQAAKDALAGKNNIPNYTGFCALRAANYSAYSEYSIIDHQVFYRR